MDNVRQEIAELVARIREAREQYYNQDGSDVDDDIYDQWMLRLRSLESLHPDLKTADSPTKEVGPPASGGFRKIRHASPMLSLENAFSPEDLREFDQRTRRFLGMTDDELIAYVAEPKIDGLAISLTYRDGRLASAATRGGGEVGEDVTANIRTIASIPTMLADAPVFMEVRGEVFMRHEDFAELNRGITESAEVDGVEPKTYANPRNAASGAVRQIDPQITHHRKLSFIAHSFGMISTQLAATHHQSIGRLGEMGMPVNGGMIRDCGDIDSVIAYYDELTGLRPSLDFDIDGMTCKVNEYAIQERLGSRSTWPRWAIACKFPPEKAWTRLAAIEIQVGRTGALSPVAKLEQVRVGGVNVSSVTLHNEDYIAGRGSDGEPVRDGKDIRIGDMVEVYRSGDVIPKISDVDLTRRPDDALPYVFPDNCPACGRQAAREEGDAVRRCTAGYDCQAQVLERLKHFVSQDAMNIEGLGGRIIEQFFTTMDRDNISLLRDPVDIYQLQSRLEAHEPPLSEWPGWGESSAANLFREINDRRSVEFSRLLFALGIRFVGSRASERIADHFGNWQDFSSGLHGALGNPGDGWHELVGIDGIGERTANALLEAFANQRFRSMVERLVDELEITGPGGHSGVQTILTNKTVVFTGTLDSMKRAEAKARAESMGARIYGSVSRNVDIVVLGKGSGAKEKKARELGLEIVEEEEWLEMIGDGSASHRLI